MQPIDRDYFKDKAVQLGLDRADALGKIQAILERRYPGKVRAASLNQSVLKLLTPSAVVAQELRLNQVDLLRAFEPHAEIERLQILIAPL